MLLFQLQTEWRYHYFLYDKYLQELFNKFNSHFISLTVQYNIPIFWALLVQNGKKIFFLEKYFGCIFYWFTQNSKKEWPLYLKFSIKIYFINILEYSAYLNNFSPFSDKRSPRAIKWEVGHTPIFLKSR